jgi:hypothetical protein
MHICRVKVADTTTHMIRLTRPRIMTTAESVLTIIAVNRTNMIIRIPITNAHTLNQRLITTPIQITSVRHIHTTIQRVLIYLQLQDQKVRQ